MSKYEIADGRTPAKINGISGSMSIKMAAKPKMINVVETSQMKDTNGVPIWVLGNGSFKAAKTQPENSAMRMETRQVPTPVVDKDGKPVMDHGNLNLVVDIGDAEGRNLDRDRLPVVTTDTVSPATLLLWEAFVIALRKEVSAAHPTLEIV